jgi:hypothetical protein
VNASKNGLFGSALAGVIIGGIFGFVLLVTCSVYCCLYRIKRRGTKTSNKVFLDFSNGDF